MMRFHFIIFSYLLSHGGGRETWLNQFVPHLLSRLPRAQIYIHYITDSTIRDKDFLENLSDSRVHLLPVHVSARSGGIGSSQRILKFLTTVTYRVRKQSDGDAKVVAIGSFYEGMIVFLLRWLRVQRGYQLTIWLRSVWSLQVLAIHRGVLARLSVWLEHQFLKSADMLIANGWDTAKAYKKLNQLESVVIPNAVDVEKFSGCSDKVLEHSLPYKVSFIGRLSQEKGLVDFLSSVECFNKQFPSHINQIQFEIVGDGYLKETVMNYVEKERNLSFIGALSQKDIPNYLCGIDASVGLTFSTGHYGGGAGVSNGLLEILASGRLLICWDSLIYRQVADCNSALIVEEGSVQGLADKYESLLMEQTINMKRAEEGRRVAERFSFENHLSQFLESLDIQA